MGVISIIVFTLQLHIILGAMPPILSSSHSTLLLSTRFPCLSFELDAKLVASLLLTLSLLSQLSFISSFR